MAAAGNEAGPVLGVQAFIDRFFDSDDSDDENFGGFNDQDLDEAVFRANVELNHPEFDPETEEDIANGWVKGDERPFISPFTGTPGLLVNDPQEKDPIDYFNLLFRDTMWDTFVLETNRYAAQTGGWPAFQVRIRKQKKSGDLLPGIQKMHSRYSILYFEGWVVNASCMTNKDNFVFIPKGTF
jgi:hypothetical protein